MHGMHSFVAGTSDYATLPSIAIDYAVVEKSNHIWVTPSSFSWHDVGNVTVFLSLKKQHATDNNLIQINSYNNLIEVPESLTVALIDVDDLCIVQTDNALLITKQGSAEKVRDISHYLKKKKDLAALSE